MKSFILTAFFAFFLSAVNAQVKGVVFGSLEKDKKIPLYGAKIKLLNNPDARAITKEDGTFELILPKKNLPDQMVISARGFNSDTVTVTKKDRFAGFEITLYSDQLLPEMIVAARQESHSILRLKVLHVENISADELRKAACCNLSESFETNASVDVTTTDAVSGAKRIKMMGLDGVYTQIQMENIPFLKGWDTPYGLHSIPGTWIESIQITKGSGTVVNGYESMAGLINVELKKPETAEAFFLNAYTNRFGRTELNLNGGARLDDVDKWSTAWFASGAIAPFEMDGNRDGFRDMPTGKDLSLLNRYNYEGEKMEAQFGVNFNWHDKLGGQIDQPASNPLTPYRVPIDSRRLEAFAKTGFFLKRPLHSIGIVYNAKYQTLNGTFGPRIFSGDEKRGYINAIYNGIIGSSTHNFKLGASGLYNDIQQSVDTLSSNRIEIVPGVFGEYTYEGARLSAVLGVRADYHNLYGFQWAPRVHFKYAASEYTDLRLSAGKGWRVPNYIADNLFLLASSRTWIAPDTLVPEISWNVGGSFIQRFRLFKQKGSLTVDFFHTRFENQLVTDRDADPQSIVFSNVPDASYSNSLQVELSISPVKNLEFRFAYKWLDVQSNFGGVLQQQNFVPRHRGFVNVGYKTRNKRWEYDVTCSVFGKARLPVALLPDGSLSQVNESEVFPLLSGQITHIYRRWDFYIGVENALNYMQSNPIIDAQNPYSQAFDATRIWAPIFGTNVYAGVRFSIKQSKEEE